MNVLPTITTVTSESHRHSVASTSGTSFFTARASPLTPTTPESMTPRPGQSRDTLGLDSNTVSVFNKTTVMHVVSTDVALHGNTLPHAFLPSLTPVGPPPPSPPASIKHGDEPDAMLHGPLKPEPTPRPLVFEDPLAVERARSPPSSTSRDRTGSVDSRDTPRAIPRSPPSAFHKPSTSSHQQDLLHRSSTDTRLSTLSARTGASSTRAPRTLPLPDGTSEVLNIPEASASGSALPSSAKYMRGHASSLSQSPDGYLHPPPGGSGPLHPARRNTTGGHIRPVRSAPQAGCGYDVETDIEDDIQVQAEQIRRERKRAKAQKDAEEALTRTTSRRRGSVGKEEENKVLVGNLIGEDHVNYVLMYNMLTGIRIAVSVAPVGKRIPLIALQVSRCQAKIKRPLTDEDFTARHKYSFDMYACVQWVLSAARLRCRQRRK